MLVTHNNYRAVELNQYYMSNSQFRTFLQCQARAVAECNGAWLLESEAFTEGSLFEAMLVGGEELENFKANNPDMFSSRGNTKGELKSNYKRIEGSVAAFKRQPLFMQIIKHCEPQRIFTGEIAGVPFKCMVDWYAPKPFEALGIPFPAHSTFDTKTAKDFKNGYSEHEQRYVKWPYIHGYHYQMAIYREIVGGDGVHRLLAVTKEDLPDVSAVMFPDTVLDDAIANVRELAPIFQAIKRREMPPTPCGRCAYCKTHKVLMGWDVVVQ